MSRGKFLISLGYIARCSSTRCSRSVGGKQCRLPKIKRSKSNVSRIHPGMFKSDKTCASMPSPLFKKFDYRYELRLEKTHRLCFISNLSKAAWLKYKRRRMRLFSAWQPGARRVSFRCSLFEPNSKVMVSFSRVHFILDVKITSN